MNDMELALHLECFNADLKTKTKTYQPAAAFYLDYRLIYSEQTELTVSPKCHKKNSWQAAPWSHSEQNWVQMTIGSSFQNTGKKCWWLPSPASNYTSVSNMQEETFATGTLHS
jgi:hypothetical protein